MHVMTNPVRDGRLVRVPCSCGWRGRWRGFEWAARRRWRLHVAQAGGGSLSLAGPAGVLMIPNEMLFDIDSDALVAELMEAMNRPVVVTEQHRWGCIEHVLAGPDF